MISIEIFNINFYPPNFKHFQQNITVSKSTIIYYWSSTMACGIGQARKLIKKTEINFTTSLVLNQHLQHLPIVTTSWMKTLESLVKQFTAEEYYRKKYSLDDKPYVIIQKNMHPTITQKTCWFQMFLLKKTLSSL